jgi:predicted GNAT family acetyltransferase
MDLQVADHPDQARFEIRADGELAGFLQYHLRGDEIALTHTETDDRFRGHGVGGFLVRSTLEQIRTRNLKVLPYCPFVNRWIIEHHEYADLVPADRRPQFGL